MENNKTVKALDLFDEVSLGTQVVIVHKGEKSHTLAFLEQEAALAKEADRKVVASTELKGQPPASPYYFSDKAGHVQSVRIYAQEKWCADVLSRSHTEHESTCS